jgi:hypothetical protein
MVENGGREIFQFTLSKLAWINLESIWEHLSWSWLPQEQKRYCYTTAQWDLVQISDATEMEIRYADQFWNCKLDWTQDIQEFRDFGKSNKTSALTASCINNYPLKKSYSI